MELRRRNRFFWRANPFSIRVRLGSGSPTIGPFSGPGKIRRWCPNAGTMSTYNTENYRRPWPTFAKRTLRSPLISRRLFPFLELIWADGGYRGPKLAKKFQKLASWKLEIVKRNEDASGFEVLPRRWVVERTFAWMGRNRRLAKDFEKIVETSMTYLEVAMIQLMIRRLARS